MSPALPREERDAMVDRATCETAGPVFPDTYTWHYRRDVPTLLDALDAAEAALAAARAEVAVLRGRIEGLADEAGDGPKAWVHATRLRAALAADEGERTGR